MLKHCQVSLKVEKTPLTKDIALYSAFAEDYVGSSKGVKMSTSQPKNIQNSTTP